jgi:hypothetical protein
MYTNRGKKLELDLDHTFSVPKMERVWKKTIRAGLRNQTLNDLHDFLDVHRHLKSYLKTLRSDVISGRYRPNPPEVVFLEKRDGISRRLMLPSPGDALLFQTIVEVLEPEIKKKQPHANAFYSRSHDHPRLEEIDGTFAYPWWLLWPEFQKRIWRFTEAHQYLVVADISNYFDCIPLGALRNSLSGMGEFNEDLLNFLFYMLEAFTWRPFYMPHSGVGLPQVDFDAPRLLAHSYLFRADSELQEATAGDFVRWMDDINCGVDSKKEARKLLGKLETVLNSLGLRLNIGKTKILSSFDAAKYFWVVENRMLTVIKNILTNGAGSNSTGLRVRKFLRRRFKSFKRQHPLGHQEKVYKRYFGLFGILHDPILKHNVPVLLENEPNLRSVICRYYATLGFNKLRLGHFEAFLHTGISLDDAVPFEISKTIVDWDPPLRGPTRERIVALATNGFLREGQITVSGITAALWLLAKYGNPAEIWSVIDHTKTIWTRSHWAARQVAAIYPRLTGMMQENLRNMLNSSGILEALRVLTSLDEIRSLHSLDKQLRSYLLQKPKGGKAYPITKVLIIILLLSGKLEGKFKRELRKDVLSLISDKTYRSLIRSTRFGG